MNPTNWLIGIATTLLVGLAVKQIPGLLASQVKTGIDKLLAEGDDADDELILAMVKWADKKIPGSGQGHVKYLAVANLVAARFPWFKAEQVCALIEASVDKVKAQAEAEATDHQAPK